MHLGVKSSLEGGAIKDKAVGLQGQIFILGV